MPRYNLRKLSPKIQDLLLNEFYSAINSLKNAEEIKDFFEDLLDLNERGMLARRLLAAEKLMEGKTFDEIKKELKMGVDTIERVSRCINRGRGYKMVIERIRKSRNKYK